jgi:Tfp pilus assembly protein PilX
MAEAAGPAPRCAAPRAMLAWSGAGALLMTLTYWPLFLALLGLTPLRLYVLSYRIGPVVLAALALLCFAGGGVRYAEWLRDDR